MIITSPSFEGGEPIPRKFTCDGYDINPELQIQNAPEEAKSLALIVDDPDAPDGTGTHWTIWNIRPDASFLKEESVAPGSVEGMTSAGRTGFHGPCPPPGAAHRYFFRLYALDTMLELKEGASREELETLIQRHLIAEAELMGTYGRE
jgi:Raf kinase inhibitor-like YbhB/YbcL family protein